MTTRQVVHDVIIAALLNPTADEITDAIRANDAPDASWLLHAAQNLADAFNEYKDRSQVRAAEIRGAA